MENKTEEHVETNKEHFFESNLLCDTIMLLTYDNHPRPECRFFKKLLSEMRTKELTVWLNAPRDKRFNW